MPTAQRAHTNEHTGFADETEIGVRLSGEHRFEAGGWCLAAWRSYASLFKIAPACQTQPAFENGLVGNSANTWFRLEAVLQVSRKKLFNVEVRGENRQAKRPSRLPGSALLFARLTQAANSWQREIRERASPMVTRAIAVS